MAKTYQRIESYYAGSYWGPRKETPEACARRLSTFLSDLSEIDPFFSRWFRQGKSRKDALSKPIERELATLEEFISRNRDRASEELGYSFWAWNGVHTDYDDSGFNILCGSYSEGISNACVINLPTRGPNADRVLTGAILAKLVRSMVMAWEPESAIATSTVHRELVTNMSSAGTFVGWVMYFPRGQGPLPPLPEPVRTEPVGDLGTLLILTPERFTASNPEHVALAARVQELLKAAGLLHPEPSRS